MSLLEWCAVLTCVGLAVVIMQLANMGARLGRAGAVLESLDSELFHLAQEQSPAYGECSTCRRRANVCHVVPKDRKPAATDPELFYCHACWWLFKSVQLGDEKRYFKDRLTPRDQLAAMVGPDADRGDSRGSAHRMWDELRV